MYSEVSKLTNVTSLEEEERGGRFRMPTEITVTKFKSFGNFRGRKLEGNAERISEREFWPTDTEQEVLNVFARREASRYGTVGNKAVINRAS